MPFSIVAYCSKNYFDPALIRFINSWSEFSSNVCIYTDFDLLSKSDLINRSDGKVCVQNIFEPSFDPGTNYCRKAEALLDFTVKHDFHIVENILLLDIDCLLFKNPQYIFKNQLDIIVTVNESLPENKRLNNISAGFLALKNKFYVFQFIKEWVREQHKENGPCRDQATLSRLIKNSKLKIGVLPEKLFNSYPYTSSPGEIMSWQGRITTNKEDLYNLHFAHGLWRNDNLVNDIQQMIQK